MTRLESHAPAKVNLTLRVLGRRSDGLHELSSLVAFAAFGDDLQLEPGHSLELSVVGPNAAAAGPIAANLVLVAARALAERVEGLRVGRFVLIKRLPVGAGLGGGSADAAAALRLLAQVNGMDPADHRLREAAAVTGADVTACLVSRAQLLHGAGERVSEPLDFPALPAVIVFPGIPAATAEVYRALELRMGNSPGTCSPAEIPREPDALLRFLVQQSNDLEPTARNLVPAIGTASDLLHRTDHVRLVRMSGSGSAVFGLYDRLETATRAADEVRRKRPDWWVIATTLS